MCLQIKINDNGASQVQKNVKWSAPLIGSYTCDIKIKQESSQSKQKQYRELAPLCCLSGFAKSLEYT